MKVADVKTIQQRDAYILTLYEALAELHKKKDKCEVGSKQYTYYDKKIYAYRERVRFYAGSPENAAMALKSTGHPVKYVVLERWKRGGYTWWQEGGKTYTSKASKKESVKDGVSQKNECGLSYLASVITEADRKAALKAAMDSLRKDIEDRKKMSPKTPEYNRVSGRVYLQKERVRFLSGDPETAAMNIRKCGWDLLQNTLAKWRLPYMVWWREGGVKFRITSTGTRRQIEELPPDAHSIRREGLEREEARYQAERQRKEYIAELERKRNLQKGSKTSSAYF